MRLTRRTLLAGGAGLGATAALASCGSSSESGSGNAVLVNTTEPENPLVPTNTAEVGGGRIITAAFAGLVYYKADASVENDMAESIESEDKQNWTIKLKANQKWSDGTPVKAQDFVDSWNYGALATNKQKGQSFFSPIAGFEEVSADKPKVEKLKGLKVVDDLTFEVTLVSAQSDFADRLGYSAYMPMPPSAFKDMKAFGEKPVSNGPYVVDGWDHGREIRLVSNEHYSGPRKAKNSGVTFVIYSDNDTMFNDLLSGAVDVVDQIPDSSLETFEKDLGDRAVNDPGALFQSFTISGTDANFQGDVGKKRRQALSMAIDRKTICEKIFFKTRTPATDFVSPVIPGGGAKDIPGAKVLEFNATEAKKLWDEAEKEKPFEGDFKLSYNADGPHKSWVEAVCNSLSQTLGIKATPQPHPEFGKMRAQITARELKGAWRSGWQADYPSPYNFLAPLYSTAAADGIGSNDGDYKNPEFDGLLEEALAATDEKAALEKYKAAEAVLMEDLPAIPLWYQNTLGGFSDKVSDVAFGWDTVPIYHAITKK